MKTILGLLWCLWCASILHAQVDSTVIFEEYELDREMSDGCGNTAYIQAFIHKEISYPAEALVNRIEGVVTFSFVLNEYKVSDFSIHSDPGGGCGDIVLSKFSMPKKMDGIWRLPTRNYTSVQARITRYVHFSLADTSITYHVQHPDLNGPFESVREWQNENKIYDLFDIVHPPSFPGGEREMIKYLNEKIAWDCCTKDERIKPGNNIVASFLVDKKGGVHGIEMLANALPCTTESIISALKQMPLIQGQANGCPVWVQMKMRIPIKKE